MDDSTHSLNCPSMSATLSSPHSAPTMPSKDIAANTIRENMDNAAVAVAAGERISKEEVELQPTPPPSLRLHFPQVRISCSCTPPDFCWQCKQQLQSAGVQETQLAKTAEAIRATQAMGTPYIRGRVVRSRHSNSSSNSPVHADIRINFPAADEEEEEEEEMRAVARVGEQTSREEELQQHVPTSIFFNQRAFDDTIHAPSQSEVSEK